MFINVKTTHYNSNYRSHNDSYARGILTDDQYEEGKKKSLISIQMCFWGWLYDFIPLFSQGLSTILREKYDLSFVHLPDAIVSFILIPFLHLMNDEETKLIILMENWFEGVKYVFGMRGMYDSNVNLNPH